MAGIGFELRKVIAKDSLGSFFKASLSGIFIVAGPWLLSIVSLSLISFITKNSSNTVMDQFFTILVYIFSFSLLISGGFQYLFTRIFSDFIYDNRVNESLYIILVYLLISGGVAFLIPFIITYSLVEFDNLYIKIVFSVSYQSSVINMLWIILIFVSFLKWYKKILLAFVAGIITMAIMIFLSNSTELHTLLNCYTTGNLVTLLGLIFLSVKDYLPKKLKVCEIFDLLYTYWGKYRYLFLTGAFYYFAFWIDKMLFWIHYGDFVLPFNLKLYYTYDISMYIANLSIIPGMVYFVITSETTFYIKMKKFLISLSNSDYRTIKLKREELKLESHRGIKNQTLIQSLLTLALSLLSYKIVPEYFITLIITLWAVNFQLLVFSYLNFLFYMDRYKHSFLIVTLMALINIIFFYIFMFFPIKNIPGVSYLISTAFGFVLSNMLFKYNIKRIDRYIYAENSL